MIIRYYFFDILVILTFYNLEPLVVAFRHSGRFMVTTRITRVCRGKRRMVRAGYNHYISAVPGMMVPVADTAGKGHYQDSDYNC
jgi:hypothetical protein